jgi:hypothetical protein
MPALGLPKSCQDTFWLIRSILVCTRIAVTVEAFYSQRLPARQALWTQSPGDGAIRKRMMLQIVQR